MVFPCLKNLAVTNPKGQGKMACLIGASFSWNGFVLEVPAAKNESSLTLFGKMLEPDLPPDPQTYMVMADGLTATIQC